MRTKAMLNKTAAAVLAGALAASCSPVCAVAAEQGQPAANAAAEQVPSDSFSSRVGKTEQRWSEVPSIAAAWDGVHGSGASASSLASYRNLFQTVLEHGISLLDLYEGGAPVLIEDGCHYRMGSDELNAARVALNDAKASAKANTATAYYDESRAVISAVNAALCGVEAAPDADALKLIWDGRALEQVADDAHKDVKLPKSSKATVKSSSLSIAAPLSQSGAAASFSKEGGSSKISISQNGKCTLKKGTRKGTYSARVRVAYSADTWKLVTVAFEVR